jgi:hypothetical protein
MGEDKCSAGDIADLARAGCDVLEVTRAGFASKPG